MKASGRLEQLLELGRWATYHAVLATLVSWLLLSASVFMYATFYYAFVPAPGHSGPVHPVFQPCEETPGR